MSQFQSDRRVSEGIFVEYTPEFTRASAIQFVVKHLISSDSQRRTKIVFVV